MTTSLGIRYSNSRSRLVIKSGLASDVHRIAGWFCSYRADQTTTRWIGSAPLAETRKPSRSRVSFVLRDIGGG
jgi:hypothetical protein